MIGGIWNFIKRHKKKFVFLGSFVGGSWLLYKYVLKKVQEIRDAEDKKYLMYIRRQHHFDSNQRTCNMTVLSMVPNIRETLVKNMDIDAVKEMLKSNPPNKLELWEELKIMSVTRSLSAVYGACMLSVMLRVQLNIMGGYLYLESLHPAHEQNSGDKKVVRIPPKVQERYLSVVKEFIEQGFLDFIHGLKLAVMKEFGSISLKEQLGLDNLASIFGHVRERVECGVDKPTISLYPYLIRCEQVAVPDAQNVVSPDDELYDKLIGETRDILESYDFHCVLRGSIDRGFNCVMDSLADHFKHVSAGHPDHSDIRIHDLTLAMAKLTPVLSSLLPKLCGDAPNPFIQELLMMEELKQLAANVYEAFSQDAGNKPSDSV